MKRFQDWESAVMLGEDFSTLRYHDIVPGSVSVFAIANGEHRYFECDKDFEVDYKAGKIRRLPESPIGDYKNSPFYAQEVFNHEIYNGNWGNYPYMVYISYQYEGDTNALLEDEAKRVTLEGALPLLTDTKAFQSLKRGETIRYLVYGDSISTGCEAAEEPHSYFRLFADKLERITGGKVEIINKAVGGENSRGGLTRFAEALAEANPHLVSIAYGMNDMCIHSDDKQTALSEVSREEYRGNIVGMLNAARDAGADVFLITNCIPNPCWKFTSLRAGDYPAEMRAIARDYNVPLADVWAFWERELKTGKTLHDLLLNDVNHPTTYGHQMYAAVLNTLI